MSTRAALPLLSFTLACAGQDPGVAAREPVAQVTPAEARDQLARLIAEHDRMVDGPTRDRLARRIDDLAGQRYAAWSGLYWHRDLAAAVAEARATGKPILSLRMLGRLDQDLSCANSRFFRVALYANRDVSRTLRERFILHWSSERPVPVARIDFGDGRVLERTVAGNSAHYVLDSRGRPVDVIPGLYSPALFLDALAQAHPLALRAGMLDGAARRVLVAEHHRSASARSEARFAGLGTIQLVPTEAVTDDRSLVRAEMVAASKARVEMPVVQSLQLGVQVRLEQVAVWAQGDRLWDEIGRALAGQVGPSRLDRRSRALFAALQPADWARAGQPLPAAGVERLVAAFEALMMRDAAYNELVLHQRIHQHLAGDEPADFAALNRWVYGQLFLTPAEDPWLGMATPDVFTGLPRDGIADPI
jgi:hypothetical protein